MLLDQLQALVIGLMDNTRQSAPHQWSLQGFGMLRLYIRDFARLHIWHSALQYPGVSMIHTHSWDLHSTVVAGEIRNLRFVESPTDAAEANLFHKQRRITGYRTVEIGPIEDTYLVPGSVEVYAPGQCYSQKAREIHLTDAQDGTVTLMLRKDDEQGQADIFWPWGTEWGTAKPRQATPDEIRIGTDAAYKLLGF